MLKLKWKIQSKAFKRFIFYKEFYRTILKTKIIINSNYKIFYIYFIMNMLNDIEKLMNKVGSSINYRTINLGGKFLYIEGLKSVVSFGEEEMQFQLNKALLIVSGNALKVNYLDKSICVLEGNIKSINIK